MLKVLMLRNRRTKLPLLVELLQQSAVDRLSTSRHREEGVWIWFQHCDNITLHLSMYNVGYASRFVIIHVCGVRSGVNSVDVVLLTGLTLIVMYASCTDIEI